MRRILAPTELSVPAQPVPKAESKEEENAPEYINGVTFGALEQIVIQGNLPSQSFAEPSPRSLVNHYGVTGLLGWPWVKPSLKNSWQNWEDCPIMIRNVLNWCYLQ